MEKFKTNDEYCQNCNFHFQAEEIPKDKQHLYGVTHFSHKIGLYDSDRDMTTKYMCPECEYTWDRYKV